MPDGHTLAGWINEHQQAVVEFLHEENRVLKERLREKRRLAEATAKVDNAEAAVLGAADAYTQLIESELGQGRRIPLARRMKLQIAMIDAVESAARAVDILFVAGGTSAMNDGEPLQRAFRDINALRTHYLFDLDRVSENFGRLLFGLEPLSRTPGI